MPTVFPADAVTRCEPGIAKGAFDLATRGTGIHVTVWNNPKNQLKALPWNHVRGVPLWNQEMAVYVGELSPRIAAHMQWDKLWAALMEIPEEQAIEGEAKDDGTRGPAVSLEVKQAAMKQRVWGKKQKTSEFRSAFCNQKECRFCKQDDCECECHKTA